MLLVAAAVALVVATTLLLFGVWLVRKSPRDRKIRALINLAASGVAAAQAFHGAPGTDVTKNA